MAQLTAETIMPVISALPLEEQNRLLVTLSKRLAKKDVKVTKKKKDIYDQIGEMYRPGNEEMLLDHLGIYE